MENKKFMSLERLKEYDLLIKEEINEKNNSTLSSSKSYTDDLNSEMNLRVAAIESIELLIIDGGGAEISV